MNKHCINTHVLKCFHNRVIIDVFDSPIICIQTRHVRLIMLKSVHDLLFIISFNILLDGKMVNVIGMGLFIAYYHFKMTYYKMNDKRLTIRQQYN